VSKGRALLLLRRTTRCIRAVCGLAGQTLSDSPGLGLAFSGRVRLTVADRCGERARASSEAGARSAWVWMSGFRPEEERARRLCGRSLGGECARVRKEDSLPSTDAPSGEKGLSMIEVHMRLRSIARPRRSSMSSSTFMATIAGSQHRTRSGASPISPRASPISPRIRWLSGRPILSLGPRACVTERLWSSSHRRR